MAPESEGEGMRFTDDKPDETVPVRLSVTGECAVIDAYCDGHWIEVLRLANGVVQIADHGPIITEKLRRAGFSLCGSPSIGSRSRVEAYVGNHRLFANNAAFAP